MTLVGSLWQPLINGYRPVDKVYAAYAGPLPTGVQFDPIRLHLGKRRRALKLFIALGSPYARMARITVLEKGLEGVVEFVIAQTGTLNSPYYSINPSRRVPYLVRDDGAGIEESALICDWLDSLKGERMFDIPAGAVGWEARRLEAMARSMLDGLSVWLREILLRPVSERSMFVILHEAERARRIADS